MILSLVLIIMCLRGQSAYLMHLNCDDINDTGALAIFDKDMNLEKNSLSVTSSREWP